MTLVLVPLNIPHIKQDLSPLISKKEDEVGRARNTCITFAAPHAAFLVGEDLKNSTLFNFLIKRRIAAHIYAIDFHSLSHKIIG